MKRTHLIILLLLGIFFFLEGLPSSVEAADDKARKAYLAGNYQLAYQEWKQRAEQFDAEAQFNLAFLFEMGQGVQQDLKAASIWYETAARQNYPGASEKLLAVKIRINQTYTSEFNHWLSKAEAGDAASQLVIAGILLTGEIIDKDRVEAMKWLLLAEGKARNRSLSARIRRLKTRLANKLNKPELEKAAERARHWKALRRPIQ